MSRLKSFVAPWAEIAYLKRELIGARASCSAEAKRGNRFLTRIEVLDRAIEKYRAQSRHDQAYIDALEDRLESESISAARADLAKRGEDVPLSWVELLERNPKLIESIESAGREQEHA